MITLFLVVLAVPLAQESVGTPDVIRLMNGRILVGEIMEHDLDGLVVLQARSGGVLRLTWPDLFPGEADRLRLGFGYNAEVVMPQVEADRLFLVNGDARTGLILERGDDYIQLRQGDTTTKIPRNRLAAPPDKVIVDATEVMTPEQFHTYRSPEFSLEDPMAQYEFSLELELVLALERAKEHLLLSQSLVENDPPLSQRLGVALDRVEISLLHKAELKELIQIRQSVYRDRYAEARLALDAFADAHQDTPFWEDYLSIEASFEEKRKEGILRYLKKHWYSRVGSMVKRQALQRDASVQSLQTWAETTLPQLMREAMVAELQEMKEGLDESEVESIWVSRLDNRPKRHQAGFGVGTWVLGEERARAGMKVAAAEEDDGKTAAQKEIESRFNDYLKNLERTRQAAGVSQEASPDDWWKVASSSERYQWLLAYYAEYSGDYALVSVRFENCFNCNGAGVFQTRRVSAGEDEERPERRECPVCHGISIRRGIYFK